MGALGSAISGLQASQKWLDVISNNVSNSNTVGFKKGRTSFAWAFSDSIEAASSPNSVYNIGGQNPTQVGLGVRVSTVQNIMKQGDLQVTGNASDVAIAGNGFLTVSRGDDTFYTRAGNLTFDVDGNLVAPGGGLVQGWIQQIQRNPSAPGPMTMIERVLDTSNVGAVKNIQIPANLVLAPQATSSESNPLVKGKGVVLAGNLDNRTSFNTNSLPTGVGTIGNPAPPPAGPAITTAGLAAFQADAVSNVDAFDSLGTKWEFTMLWQQVGQTPGEGATWAWTMWYTPNAAFPDANAAWNPTGGGAPEAGAFVGDSSGLSLTGPGSFVASENRYTSTLTGLSGAVVFNADGSLADNGAVDPITGLSPTNTALPGANVDPLNIQFAFLVPNGAVGPGTTSGMLTFSVNMGTPNDPPPPSITVPPVAPLPTGTYGLRDGLTGDFGRGSFDLLGNYSANQTVFTASVDGYTQGNLLGLQINIFGEIEGTFDNDKVVAVASLALTRFQNPEGLEKADSNFYRETINSGTGQVGQAGKNGFGVTMGGQLENSNVDLTLELTNMILAQRMFESSARIVTAQDRVFEKLTELGRY